jgi:hypothetical protein
LLNQTSVNQRTLSDRELVDSSPVIVRGVVEAVADGRTIDFASGPSHPIKTAVIRVRVLETIKGSGVDTVHFEYIRGGVTPAQLDAANTKRELLLFLKPADSWDPTVHKFDNAGKGVAAGYPLLELRSQQGLIVQADNGLEEPLTGDPAPSFDGATTLPKAAEAVKRTVVQ